MTTKHPTSIQNKSFLIGLSIGDAVKITANGYRFSLKFKKSLWKSFDKKCCYCGDEIETHTDMHVDHFNPKQKIINESLGNLVCSCSRCNVVKNNRDLEDFRFCLAVYKSKLNGVILPSVAKKLLSIGVELPIKMEKFRFEVEC